MTVLFLTMGLVTTVIVALLLALLVDVEQGAQSTGQSFVDDEQWTVTRWDRAGAASIRSVRSRGGANWGPQQAAGPPNTPSMGDNVTAWASASQDSGPEWLILEYAKAVIPRRVDVYETYSPGALVKVTVFDDAGAEHDAWSGVDPTRQGNPTVGISQVPISLDVPTRRVKIYLASDQVPGWNEIDAVGLVSDKGEVQWAKRVRASTTYASGSYNVGPTGQPELLAPPWTGLDQATRALEEGTIAQEVQQVDARGWPMLALWSTTDLSPKPVTGATATPPSTALSLTLEDSIDTGFRTTGSLAPGPVPRQFRGPRPRPSALSRRSRCGQSGRASP